MFEFLTSFVFLFSLIHIWTCFERLMLPQRAIKNRLDRRDIEK